MFKEIKLPDFWLNVTKLASGSILSQFFVIFLTPFLTRIYSPEDYGVLGVVNSLAGIIIILSALRLERAIVLVESDEANKLLNLCNTITLTIFLLFLILIFSFQSFFLNILGLEKIEYLFFITIIVLLNGILNSYKSYGNSMKFYNLLSFGIVMNSIVSSLLKLTLGSILNPNAFLLLVSEVTAVFITLIYLFIAFRNKNHFLKFKFPNLIYTKKVFLEQKDFLKYDILSSLLNNASWMAPIFILSFFFDKTIVGYYTLGFTMLRLPMNLLGKAIGDVFYKKSSDLNDKEKITKSVINVISRLFSFGLLPILFILLFGDHLFTIVFGEKWNEAGVYSQILSLWTLMWFISSPISNLYYVLKLQKKLLNFTSVSLLLRTTSLGIGGYFKDPILAILLFSFVSFFLYLYQLFYLSCKVRIMPKTLFKVFLKEIKVLLLPIIGLVILCFLEFSFFLLIFASLIVIASLCFKSYSIIFKKKYHAKT